MDTGFRKKKDFEGGGLILFSAVDAALKTEKILKAGEYDVKLVAPPPALRKGCDLAVEINLVERTGIERLLSQKCASFDEILPVKGQGELLRIVKVTDFGDAVMVKAGNMKLTFAKDTGRILNISGGGCPDIPYLHTELVDRNLSDAPRPRDRGFTLCSLMLDRAFVESLDLWKNNGKG